MWFSEVSVIFLLSTINNPLHARQLWRRLLILVFVHKAGEYLYSKQALAFTLALDEYGVISDTFRFWSACSEPTSSPTQVNKVIIQPVIQKLIVRGNEWCMSVTRDLFCSFPKNMWIYCLDLYYAGKRLLVSWNLST